MDYRTTGVYTKIKLPGVVASVHLATNFKNIPILVANSALPKFAATVMQKQKRNSVITIALKTI